MMCTGVIPPTVSVALFLPNRIRPVQFVRILRKLPLAYVAEYRNYSGQFTWEIRPREMKYLNCVPRPYVSACYLETVTS